jgi:hypothetical protein
MRGETPHFPRPHLAGAAAAFGRSPQLVLVEAADRQVQPNMGCQRGTIGVQHGVTIEQLGFDQA